MVFWLNSEAVQYCSSTSIRSAAVCRAVVGEQTSEARQENLATATFGGATDEKRAATVIFDCATGGGEGCNTPFCPCNTFEVVGGAIDNPLIYCGGGIGSVVGPRGGAVLVMV